MKRLFLTNLGVSLAGTLRRNNILPVALALFIIGTAFLLIVHYEKESVALQRKWHPRQLPGSPMEDWNLLGRVPIIKSRDTGLARYNIKANLTTVVNMGVDNLEIKFCDKYSLFLSGGETGSGVYYKTGNGAKKYVSTAGYRMVIPRKQAVYPQLKKLNLFLKCNLIERTTDIYINDKFIEKVYLSPEENQYAVRLSINSPGGTTKLGKLKISDHKGKVLFNADYGLLFFYKLASQILIFLGVLFLLGLIYSEKRFFKRLLYFTVILLSIEGFLRIGERDNQNFNIRLLNPRWKFVTSTNLYGTYDNAKEIAIKTYPNPYPKIYQIPKPENTRRIICMGTSPVAGVILADPMHKSFPAILGKKINPGREGKNRVINIASVLTYIDSPEPNIYLKDVLFKLSPDLVIIYGTWTPTPVKNSRKYIEDNYILYNKAKEIMRTNSSWIKNDRLLYAALEFKKPIKEIVYLYHFLCKSYLFMGLENIRKRVFNRLYFARQELSVEKPESYFEETLKLCRENKIKLLLIPQFDFLAFQSDSITKQKITRIISENPEVYYLDLEKAFRANKSFSLAFDTSHPTEYGHMIIAEEILKKLTQMGLIDPKEVL